MSPPASMHRRGWLMLLFGWALAFFVVTGFYHMVLSEQQNPNRLSVMSLQEGELVLRENKNGHYLVEGTLNGSTQTFLVDTGATQIAVPQAVAERVALPRKHRHRIQTAAGPALAWSTEIDTLQIGFIKFNNLRGVIVPDMQGDVILLGMNALGALHLTQTAGTLKLRPLSDE